jgi:hypothetical protein
MHFCTNYGALISLTPGLPFSQQNLIHLNGRFQPITALMLKVLFCFVLSQIGC